jgi:hypothetical protein
MASTPVFITQYELLRSQDYVLITFRAPSGKVVDGRMQTDEVQRVALTIPRFLELAATLGQMADNVRALLEAGRPATPRARPANIEPRATQSNADSDADDADQRGSGDWIVRH